MHSLENVTLLTRNLSRQTACWHRHCEHVSILTLAFSLNLKHSLAIMITAAEAVSLPKLSLIKLLTWQHPLHKLPRMYTEVACGHPRARQQVLSKQPVRFNAGASVWLKAPMCASTASHAVDFCLNFMNLYLNVGVTVVTYAGATCVLPIG